MRHEVELTKWKRLGMWGTEKGSPGVHEKQNARQSTHAGTEALMNMLLSPNEFIFDEATCSRNCSPFQSCGWS